MREDPFGRHLRIQEIGLEPEYRRRGIGTQTINLVMDAYSAAGFDIYKCEIGNHNVESIGLFHKLGFTCKGPVDGLGAKLVSVHTRPKDLAPQAPMEGEEAAPGLSSGPVKPE